MIIIRTICAYFLAWLIGYLWLTMLDRKKQLPGGLKAACGWLLGTGVLSLQMFVLATQRFSVNTEAWLVLVAVNLAALLLLYFLNSRQSLRRLFRPGATLAAINTPATPASARRTKISRKVLGQATVAIILLALLGRIILSFWQVTQVPTYDFDAWNNWNLRARVITLEERLPLIVGQPFYLGGGITSYPLNVSLSKVYLAQLAGGWQESVVNTASLAVYISLLAIFFFLLPAYFSRLARSVCVFLLSGLPFLYLHSWAAYADLPLAAYLFLTLAALAEYLKNKTWPYLFLGAVSLALCIWTKNEGLTVIAPVLLLTTGWLVVSRKISWQAFSLFWLAGLALSGPWLFFRQVNHLGLLSGDSHAFSLAANRQFLPEWFNALFWRSNFNFLYLLFALVIAWQAKKIWQELPLRFLALNLGLLFGFYSAIILLTDRALDLGALVRVNLHLAPVSFYLLLLILSQIDGLQKLFTPTPKLL